jgi:hypothetical protein
MPDTLVTLRPNSVTGADGWSISGGPSTVHDALSDDNDGTYATGPGTSDPCFVGFGNLVGVTDGSRITSVTVRIRWSGDNSAYGAIATEDVLGSTEQPHIAFYAVPSATETKPFAAMTVRPAGGPWTVDAVNAVTVRLAANTTAVRFYEAYLDVRYDAQPTVTAVGPSGVVTSQAPTITWTYADANGDPQERWQVKVFTQAVATGPGFSPETSPAVADSGDAFFSSAGTTAWTLPSPLSPGVYHAHVRAADAGSNGRYSAWASTTLTVVGDPPAPPLLLSATPEPDRGRVVLKIRQTDNMLNEMTASGDGIEHEYLRWFVFGNITAPAVAEGGGITGNRITATVIANGEVAITQVRTVRVIPGADHVWAGRIKATPGGLVHLDVEWLDEGRSFAGLDEGTVVGLTADYQPSSGRVRAPDHAHSARLAWRSSGNLTAGQDLSWDDCGIWLARDMGDTPELAALRARIEAAESDIVGLQIRVAQLEGVPPVITIQPTDPANDASAYRGGLDSSNLLGPADASFDFTLAGTNWAAVGTGSLATAPDGAAYEGYSLQYAPGTPGGSHLLRLNRNTPLPLAGANYQFSFRCRANVAGLVTDAAMVYTDANGVAVATLGTRVDLPAGAEFSDPVVGTLRAPIGATHVHLELRLTGDTTGSDRWVFDQFQVVRMPLVQPEYGFGVGPFGVGPFGGTTGTFPVMAWKSASQMDVYPLVEYSVDDGATWAPVRLTERAAYDPLTRVAIVHDYEAPAGRQVLYRARTAARDYQTDPVSGVLIVSAPTEPATVTLTASGYWILDPFTQVRLPFRVIGSPPVLEMERPRPQGEFSPSSRTHKVITSDRMKGREFSWRIALPDDAAWDAFESMLETGHTLLVTTPRPGRQWYVQPGGSTGLVSELENDVDHGAVLTFAGYEQARPGADV